jgi:hypothetical protein
MPGTYTTSAATFNPILSSTATVPTTIVPSFEMVPSPRLDDTDGYEVVGSTASTLVEPTGYIPAANVDMHVDDDL